MNCIYVVVTLAILDSSLRVSIGLLSAEICLMSVLVPWFTIALSNASPFFGHSINEANYIR